MKKANSRKPSISGIASLICFMMFGMLTSLTGYSQDTTLFTSGRNYTVKQDEKITALVGKYIEYNRNREFAEGYRLQIMYTDVRDEAYKSKGAMYKEFPDLVSYVEYEQPYY